LSQLADTLSYLHSNNIAHRDIKLENILINKNTLKIKLIDFGFAIKASGHSVRSTLIGTPCYLPP
jgi:MAP/microtubule affinity-regulating kinase